MNQINVPKLNLRKLNRAIDHIEKFPETYNQNDVVLGCDITKKTPCGAIGCLGGWLVLLENPRNKRHDLAELGGSVNSNGYETITLIGPNENTAQSIAGLTAEEADYLFAGATGSAAKDLKIVKHRVSEILRARQYVKEVNDFLKEKPGLEVEGYEFVTHDGTSLNYDDIESR